jgi:hypothetical protein
MGLDVQIEEEKNRLNELVPAFRKAGYRTRETVSFIDDEVLKDIDMELPEGKKLKGGEKRALKGIAK